MTIAHHLQTLGVVWLLLAGLNVFVVPRWFRWNLELARLSLFTRQVFHVHCLFIVLVLLMMGVLSLCYPQLLLEPSPIAALLLGGLFAFWLVRLLVQWFVYDRRLWRGNRVHTIAHYAFTFLWMYATAVYGLSWWLNVSLGSVE